MAKFKVKIIKSNVAFVEVEADNHDLAEAIVEQRYYSGGSVVNEGTIDMDEGGVEFDAEEVVT